MWLLACAAQDAEGFVQPEGTGEGEDEGAHKRLVSSLMRTLTADGHDVKKLWRDIGEVCVKTLISVRPAHPSRAAVHVL